MQREGELLRNTKNPCGLTVSVFPNQQERAETSHKPFGLLFTAKFYGTLFRSILLAAEIIPQDLIRIVPSEGDFPNTHHSLSANASCKIELLWKLSSTASRHPPKRVHSLN